MKKKLWEGERTKKGKEVNTSEKMRGEKIKNKTFKSGRMKTNNERMVRKEEGEGRMGNSRK